MPLPSLSESNCCPNCGAPLPENAPQGLCPKCLFAGLAVASEDDTGSAAQARALTPEELAPHFPQLEVLEYLGRGGMGVVYKVRQKSLNRLAALKLLAPERVTDAHFAERFTREAHALAALNHPHIVTVYDFGEAGGFYFLLMEFVDGVNLRQAMQAGRFTPEQALAVVPPVCEALQYAHEHGIVHRDIKPENLLLDKAGRVKIADFGIAKILDDESRTGLAESQPAGTPQYMAPEQTAHLGADHRADIYSLGVVLYEMLTGERPQGNLVPPSKRVQVDVRIDEVVLRALEKEPERRYQTASEMRTQVETIVHRRGPAARANTEPEVEPRFSRLAIWGACWVPLFFITLFFWFFKSHAAHNGEYQGPPWWVQALLIALLVLGAAAPFGTTVFGWVAVSQIRRSAGKFYGMWLAVFDGLLFPLLVLDGIVVAVFATGMQLWARIAAANAMRSVAAGRIQPSFFDTGLSPYEMVIVPLLVLGLVIWVDWLIIRSVWRAVNRTPGTPAPLGNAASPKRRSTGRVVAIGCGVLVLGALVLHLIAVVGVFAFSSLRRTEANREVQVASGGIDANRVYFLFSHADDPTRRHGRNLTARSGTEIVDTGEATKFINGKSLWYRIGVDARRESLVAIVEVSEDQKHWETERAVLDQAARPAVLNFTNGLSVSATLVPRSSISPTSLPEPQSLATAPTPNELRKLFPEGFEGMTPKNRKAALKFVTALVAEFQSPAAEAPVEIETALETKFAVLNQSIESLRSGNTADRRAYAAALRVEECFMYIAQNPSNSTRQALHLNRLLRITKDSDTEDLARGISSLLCDYARLVLGGKYADTELSNRQILEEVIPKELAK